MSGEGPRARRCPGVRQNDAVIYRSVKLFAALLVFGLAAMPALAQRDPRIEALGAFDQIAIECAHDGGESVIDGYRLKLWRAYLGPAESGSDRDVRDMIAGLRRDIFNDVADELLRQYKAAKAAIPQVGTLGDADQQTFYKLCESPTIHGLPDRK